MKLNKIVTASFFISLFAVILGMYFKISHTPIAENWLLIASIPILIFIASAIYEVRSSNKINQSEKTMWTVAFIFLTFFAGMIYFIMARKRISMSR